MFRNTRTGSPLTGQHWLLPIFSSVDAFAVESSWTDCSLSLETLLQLPPLELCNQAHTDISFVTNNQIRMKPAHILLEPSRLNDSVVFKARGNCSKPTLWSKTTAAVRDNDIQFLPSLPPVYLSSPAGPEPLPVSGGSDDLCEYCGHRETTAHLLFTCQSNLEIWSNYFALIFLPLELWI